MSHDMSYMPCCLGHNARLLLGTLGEFLFRNQNKKGDSKVRIVSSVGSIVVGIVRVELES